MNTQATLRLFALALLTAVPFLSGCEDRVIGFDQHQYFETLDYNDPKIAQRIPDFEHQLIGVSDKIVALARQTKNPQASPYAHQAGLSLAYTAIYIGNTNYGVLDSKLSIDDVTARHRFAPVGASAAEEMAAREYYAWTLSSLGHQLAPGEEVIDGIVAANWYRHEAFKYGKPSRAAAENLVAVAESKPSFNLFASMNVLFLEEGMGLDQDLLDRLFVLAKKRYERQDRCHQGGGKKPHPCNPDRSIVPWVAQEAPLFLGDIYFMDGAKELESDPGSPDAWEKIRSAGDIYQSSYTGRIDVPKLFQGFIRKQTNHWRNKDLVDSRIEQARESYSLKQLPPADFWKGRRFNLTYQCATCHSK